MATRPLIAANTYEADHDGDFRSIRFFTTEGSADKPSSWYFWRRSTWYIVSPALGSAGLYRPSSLLPEIRLCMDLDTRQGNTHKVAELQVGALQAVILFLEEKITFEHLQQATEREGYILIPRVEIHGRQLTIRVLEQTRYAIATADAAGNVLKTA